MWVGMGADAGGSDPATDHDSDIRLMVSMRGPSRASSRRITPGSSSGTTLLQPADDRLSPLIRPYPCPIRPKRARFVPAHARFVPFWVLWLDG